MKKIVLIAFMVLIAFFGLLGTLNADNKTDEGTWISISGTIVDPKMDKLTLDYGKGFLDVNMRDWKWYDKNYSKMAGNRVTVYGKVTDELFQKSTMDASSVYDERMGKYFYGIDKGAKGEDWVSTSPPPDYWITGYRIKIGEVKVRGIITSVNGIVFTIGTGPNKINLSTSDMPYHPLDKRGLRYIREGNYVAVTGRVGDEFSTKHEIIAEYIVTLDKNQE